MIYTGKQGDVTAMRCKRKWYETLWTHIEIQILLTAFHLTNLYPKKKKKKDRSYDECARSRGILHFIYMCVRTPHTVSFPNSESQKVITILEFSSIVSTRTCARNTSVLRKNVCFELLCGQQVKRTHTIFIGHCTIPKPKKLYRKCGMVCTVRSVCTSTHIKS